MRFDCCIVFSLTLILCSDWEVAGDALKLGAVLMLFSVTLFCSPFAFLFGACFLLRQMENCLIRTTSMPRKKYCIGSHVSTLLRSPRTMYKASPQMYNMPPGMTTFSRVNSFLLSFIFLLSSPILRLETAPFPFTIFTIKRPYFAAPAMRAIM